MLQIDISLANNILNITTNFTLVLEMEPYDILPILKNLINADIYHIFSSHIFTRQF